MLKDLLEQKNIWMFDFDGTLVDSMGMWYEVDKAILARHGLIAPEGFSDMLVPLSEQETAQCFLDLGCRGTVESIMQEINELADHEYATSISLKPGVKAVLDELKNHGVKLALVTAATLPRILPCLDRNGLSGYFNLILNCDAVGLPKSDPDIYRTALDYLKGKPEDAVFFEDNLTALRAASSIGITTVGVYDDHAARYWEDMQKAATVALRSYEEIGL